MRSTADFSAEITRLKNTLKVADAVVIGAGAGLSTAAGFTYTGERFEKYFSDFIEKYGLTDMYSGGFFPFETSEEHWAYWSRYIYCNRYTDVDNGVYKKLFELVNDKNYFVLTTNVDHQFQKAGFDKKRLFYTQGDYGLFQCSEPCHNETYDNEKIIRKMFADQKNMRVPTELVPICPKCGKHMTMNLRADDKFVQDNGWYKASERYNDFILRHSGSKILFLELGVGFNTPSIIKFPFWKMTAENPNAVYACINYGEAFCHEEIKKQSICLNIDISEAIERLIC
ncbi:MAG: Sir2 silent information regulator family NAD-dependent deacetylase [Oscillospiraceae bacterium]|nr:Sir2 silent information regulator family NAD-dependent deacetylase [Oscillospiraceae bacterium]